ncbi:uncharacterized protein LOC117330676 [Pecten maximus]|uniref:uncharacterized protein LOC117330676 n=1 Tax=Pecten maximus TaxID=6579 RepID=UPI0014581EAD|nr:uncharacterized protein LOC117330676 [Pecten maximus]
MDVCTVTDRRKGSSGRRRSARCDENISQVKTIIEETPQRSIRKVLSDMNQHPSKSSVQRILKFDLKLTPYKIYVMQHLKESDIASRLTFTNWVLEHDDILDSVWFSDEAHFTLSAQVNKQNMRFWGTSKPDLYEEKPLHSDKVTVGLWAALSRHGIIGPFFYESAGETATVTSDRYIQILSKRFIPALRRKGHELNGVWYQQNGAAPHTANRVLTWLADTFGNRLISLRTDIEWPPHSPDLNPSDFYLWGYLKDRVYIPPPSNLQYYPARHMQECGEEFQGQNSACHRKEGRTPRTHSLTEIINFLNKSQN